MLENVKNKYLELEMEVALKTNQTITAVRGGAIVLSVIVVAALGYVGYLVA